MFLETFLSLLRLLTVSAVVQNCPCRLGSRMKDRCL